MGKWKGKTRPWYRRAYEPENCLIGYSGKAFGFRGLFLPLLYCNAAGTRKALAWSLVHDMEILLGPNYTNKSEDAFFSLIRNNPEAKFHPYWEEQKHLKRH
jgi:hypothetical protein